MKAIIHRQYGSPENLRLENIPDPQPKANQVLVKIMATGVNSWDGDMVVGQPLAYRLIFGLFKPRFKILGCDVAGVVEETGPGVSRFKPGDRVFGDLSDVGWGGFAEYVAAHESALTHLPERVTFEQAAALSQPGLLALQSLRFNGRVKPGDKVLFNGAGGGVGALGLQLAKQWGAEVTVVDHGNKLTRLKDLGADHLLDYTREDYTLGEPYDLVIDVVASKSLKDYERIIKPGGGMAIVGGKIRTMLAAGLLGGRLQKRTNKKIGLMGQEYLLEDLDYLASRVARGTLEPIIGQTYLLPETPMALKEIINGTAFGKLVIRIADQ